MRRKGYIPVHSILMDREPLNQKTLKLCHHLEGGGTVPPIHVQLVQIGPKRGSFRVLDGRHRITAFKLCEKFHIYARWGINEKIEAYATQTPSREVPRDEFVSQAIRGQTIPHRTKREVQT